MVGSRGDSDGPRKVGHWLFMAVVVAIVGITWSMRAEAADSRLVTLAVDGVRTGYSTQATTVAEVLDRAQVNLQPNDLVEPAPSTVISTQVFYINVYRAKPVVVKDGQREIKVETAYQHPKLIAEKNAGLTIHPEDSFIAEPVRDFVDTGVVGYEVTVLRAVPVSLTVDGETFEVRSHKATVAELLADKGIVTDKDDIISVKGNTRLKPGLKIVIKRVGKEVVAVEETIPAPVETIFDNNKPAGYEEVRQAGHNGRRLVTYEIKKQDGVEVSRKTLQTVILKEASKRVVVRGVTLAGDVWASLRACESGGNYATNSGNGFYGAYQFNYSTWQGNAPAEWRNVYPHQAPPNIQDLAAQNLQSHRGWSPWPACARKLGLL